MHVRHIDRASTARREPLALGERPGASHCRMRSIEDPHPLGRPGSSTADQSSEPTPPTCIFQQPTTSRSTPPGPGPPPPAHFAHQLRIGSSPSWTSCWPVSSTFSSSPTTATTTLTIHELRQFCERRLWDLCPRVRRDAVAIVHSHRVRPRPRPRATTSQNRLKHDQQIHGCPQAQGIHASRSQSLRSDQDETYLPTSCYLLIPLPAGRLTPRLPTTRSH